MARRKRNQHRDRGVAEFTEKKKPSNKEIENEEEQTDQKKYGAAVDATAREVA